MRAVTLESFLEKVYPEPNTGCWLWGGRETHSGYGQALARKLNLSYAHRISYYLYKGDFDRSLHVLHKCDTPACVNPDHLFLGTQADNNHDKFIKKRCKYGEETRSSKLTRQKVSEIREKYATGKYTMLSLAKEYNAGETTIYYILKNVTWQ